LPPFAEREARHRLRIHSSLMSPESSCSRS
jgi:hypothetical protein